MYTTQIDHMNLNQIANSGQCFRWQQINDNTYKIPAFGKELTISQDGNIFVLSCEEDEWNSLWRSYFDLETNYNEVENIIMNTNDDFLKAAYQFGSGIRILRQDLWEVIISFIISQNNNIPRIKKSIKKLCENNNGAFPLPWKLEKMDLSDIGLGYRDKYIKDVCSRFNSGEFFGAFFDINYKLDKKQLIETKGIGDKVADCICLFGLHHLEAFPIDTHIKKIIDREYNGEMPNWVGSKYAGLFQQYIFYYNLNHKGRVV